MNDSVYVAALRAIAFFDIFNHPLTDRELFEYLHSSESNLRLSFSQFLQLTQSFPRTAITSTHGLWHLCGRESLVPLRTERGVSFGIKTKKLIRAVRVMSYIPFVRSVFVCNTLAFSVAERVSDIDVLIVVKWGRMWTARILTTVVLSLFGLRRTKRKIQDRICLSFYLADRTLNVSKFKIQDDIYLSYWLRSLIPVYDPDQLGDSILRANHELLSPFLEYARYMHPTIHLKRSHHLGKRRITRMCEKLLSGSVGTRFESMVRTLQRKKIMRNPHSLVHAKDTRVVVSDSILKFHENDRRALYRDLWKKRVNQLVENP